MRPSSVLVSLLSVIALSVVYPRAPSEPPQPASAAIDPLDATEAAFASYDRAAALLRENRPLKAAALLRNEAPKLASPYRYEAEYLAELLSESANPPPTADLAARERHHRKRAFVRANLGDFRSAADEYWTISEFDPVRFADSSDDMATLRDFLVWSECSEDELRRLVRLAALVPEHRRQYSDHKYYESWESSFERDCKRIAFVQTTDADLRIRKVLEYAGARSASTFEPRYVLRHLLSARRLPLTPARRQEAYARVGILLEREEDPIASQAWLRIARQLSPADADNSPEALIDRSHAAFRAGDYEKALRLDRQIVELGPKERLYGTAFVNCGACLNALGRTDEAMEIFLSVFQLDANTDRTKYPGLVTHPFEAPAGPFRQDDRSCAARQIARIYEQRGDYDRELEWLVGSHVDHIVMFGCGTCEQQRLSGFLESWADCLLRRHRTDADLEAALLIALDQGDDCALGRKLVDHYRRTCRLEDFRATLRRLADEHPRDDSLFGITPPELNDNNLSFAEALRRRRAFYADPNEYLRVRRAGRKDSPIGTLDPAVALFEELALLAQWRNDADVESLWNYCRHYRLYHLIFPPDDHELHLLKVRLAISSILEMPQAASQWLKRHPPADGAEAERESGWLLLLQAHFEPQAARREIERIVTEASAAADAVPTHRMSDDLLQRLHEAAFASLYLPDLERGPLLARTRHLRRSFNRFYPSPDFGGLGTEHRLDLRFLY